MKSEKDTKKVDREALAFSKKEKEKALKTNKPVLKNGKDRNT